MDQKERELAKEIQELYWKSGASVREVRDKLGITSATLYRLLEPLPAGRTCSACGARLGYRNRSARDTGVASCAGCGAIDSAEAAGTKAGRDGDAGAAPGAKTGRTGGAGASKARADTQAGDPGGAEGAGEKTSQPEPDWVADAVDDALASTEKVFREVVVVAAGLVAVLAVGVVGLLSRQRRG